MIRINIAEAKARLSRYLENVERGETVVLCRRNVFAKSSGPSGTGRRPLRRPRRFRSREARPFGVSVTFLSNFAQDSKLTAWRRFNVLKSLP